jgi:hypothetical protein
MVSREQLGSDLRTVTGQVIRDPNLFRQFPLTQLQQTDPRFAGSTSFIPPDVLNPLAGAFQQQRAPGAQYLNYPMAAPNIGGPLMPPTMPPGFGFGQPAPTPTSSPSPSPSPGPVMGEDVFSRPETQEFLDEINKEREEKGLPPYSDIREYINDQIDVSVPGYIGMADGGIASLSPVAMQQGGLLSQFGQGVGNVLGGIGTGIGEGIGGLIGGIGSGVRSAAQGIGGLLERGMENYRANQAKAEEKKSLLKKDPKTMTREELIELINMLQGKSSSGMGTKPAGDSGFQPRYGKEASIGMAEGGDPVDFPRMNGPISGPGTETSDDIPAMLSDGEFVVNAKAVRGIGRLKGAGKTKAEQRREGARMMYALQRAGEQAMRKA